MHTPRKATTSQVIAINAILKKKGLFDDKPAIISEASEGRTTSSAELTIDEAKAVLTMLLSGTQAPPKQGSRNRMISKIFAMAHEMGWVEKKTVVAEDGSLVTGKDYSRVYGWIKKYGYLHKDLKQYQFNEIPKLVTQFEMGPYKTYLNNK